MNRREFHKLAGSILLSLLLPALPAEKETDMEFSRLLEKLGRGQRLSDSEIFELKNHARDIEEVKTLAKSWVTAGTSTPIFVPPMELIYSNVLAQAAASIPVPIPNKYRHLLILGAGRNTSSGTAASYILVQANEDSGNNYEQQKLRSFSTTVDGEYSASQPGAIAGITVDGSVVDADDSAGFLCLIPHYHSQYEKNFITLTVYGGNVRFVGSNWQDSDPIQSLTFLPVSDSFAANFALSVYGIL